jgi:hypothetical protein
MQVEIIYKSKHRARAHPKICVTEYVTLHGVRHWNFARESSHDEHAQDRSADLGSEAVGTSACQIRGSGSAGGKGARGIARRRRSVRPDTFGSRISPEANEQVSRQPPAAPRRATAIKYKLKLCPNASRNIEKMRVIPVRRA